MKFLLDTSADEVMRRTVETGLVEGQLLTPLTRYANWGGTFAIDNGAFSGFPRKQFTSLLRRNRSNMSRCLFVCVPDVVGNARRTLEIFRQRSLFVPSRWPLALVAQDGIEDMDIPWQDFQCLFIGGTTAWKDSRVIDDLVRTAQIFGKHVHIGRVNSWKRFRRFAELHADTCDGSGASRYDHMLEDIMKEMRADCSQQKISFMEPEVVNITEAV